MKYYAFAGRKGHTKARRTSTELFRTKAIQNRQEHFYTIILAVKKEHPLRIMACGSIGYGGVDEVRKMYSLLLEKRFDIVDHLVHKGMDYSDIRDFRDNKELSQQIVSHDLQFIEKADVIVVLANRPSYGTAIEMYIAKNSNKKVILLAKDPLPTPWPVNFSDYLVRNEDDLIILLEMLKKKRLASQ